MNRVIYILLILAVAALVIIWALLAQPQPVALSFVATAEARERCTRPAEMYYTTNGVDPVNCSAPQHNYCPFPQ